MIRDRFVTGHRDCDLRRHLDSVPPDMSIREIEGESLECERSRSCDNDRDRDPTSILGERPGGRSGVTG